MIEIQGLTKRYGAHTAVEDLTLNIRDGLIYGFLGANGAGKSTTLGMLTGALAPSAGKIVIDGLDLAEKPIEARRKIGYLPEIPPLYPEMTACEFLRFVARARGIAKKEQDAAISAAMEKTGVSDVQNRILGKLSKGYRQRVGIAQAILGEPEILVLDEPTVGLDPAQIVEIRALIRALGTRHTIVFSSHILSEVQLLCDRVFIIDHGRLLCEDTPENLEKLLSEGETLEISLLDPDKKAEALLSALSCIQRVEVLSEEDKALTLRVLLAPQAGAKEKAAVALTDAGIAVTGMRVVTPTLEDAFLKLTGGEEKEEAR